MKNLILFLILITFSFSMEFDFKKTSLDKFEIKGFDAKIVYKNKIDRDLQIGKLWDKFLSSKDFDVDKSTDKKLYVVYSNYKANSFDCFIGIKSEKNILNSKLKIVPKSNYLNTIIKYRKNMNLSEVWDHMQKEKINRDFKVDIEQYDMQDLKKSSYFINIYLSTKTND